MSVPNYQNQILKKIEELLKITIVEIQTPKQGMDSEVLLVRDETGRTLIVKWGKNVMQDVRALTLIKDNKIDIPVPEMLGHFAFENGTVLILEHIDFPLLESISQENLHEYIPSMISNLKKLHTITSDRAGAINTTEPGKTWKELLLYKYSGKHPWFDWEDVMGREGVDRKLIRNSVEAIIKKIKETKLITRNYSLLHTDFNQRNLFVEPHTKQIASIVDWSEATFGDPLYDYARVRMFIWHFNLEDKALPTYYNLLSLTDEEKMREDLYLVSQVLDYIVWYSEKNDEFNRARLHRHQQFLRLPSSIIMNT